MTDADVDDILGIELFSNMDAEKFPASTPLRDIIRNDMCIRHYHGGDIVIRAGDYGTSAFIVMSGKVSSPLKKASLTGFHATAKHIAAKAVSPSSETMRTI